MVIILSRRRCFRPEGEMKKRVEEGGRITVASSVSGCLALGETQHPMSFPHMFFRGTKACVLGEMKKNAH